LWHWLHWQDASRLSADLHQERRNSLDEERLHDLFEEATVDCFDEEEAFWGVFHTLAEGGLNFPLRARALGEMAEVVDLDGAHSDLRRGIVALACKGEGEYPAGLAELEFVDPDPASAEWLAVYQYWLGLRRCVPAEVSCQGSNPGGRDVCR